MPHTVDKYRRKISGPIADRIDLWVQVGEMPPEILAQRAKGKGGETLRARSAVQAARERQRRRLANYGISTNAQMRAKHIECSLPSLSDKAETTLQQAARTMKLSPRGYHRTIKLARTIADLADSATIEPAHMLEALQYRAREI
jgi:magnesium chelatase family protein